MYLQGKLRFGAILMIVGSFLAASGEIVNARTTDVLSSSWHLSLDLIIVGTFILLIGLPLLTSVSDQVNGFGFIGSYLLVIGGLLLIIGTIALDWIVLPFLINLANTMAATINGSTTATQTKLNAMIANLNSLGNNPVLQKLFPGSTTHVPTIHIPRVNGTELVNQALTQLHAPTIDRLIWWGHFSLSGGTLIIGSFILGVTLVCRYRASTPTGVLLIIFALLNVLCQFFAPLPPFFANVTAVMLFLTLAWLGSSAWLSKEVMLQE